MRAQRAGVVADRQAVQGQVDFLPIAPQGGQALVTAARASGLAVERLVDLGLARLDSSGRAYDFFQGRVMFPVRDLKGRPVGFGARRLSDGDARSPKYINTPETPLYHKGEVLFGLAAAAGPMRKRDLALVVEGNVDVIQLHQHGFDHAVAPMGFRPSE